MGRECGMNLDSTVNRHRPGSAHPAGALFCYNGRSPPLPAGEAIPRVHRLLPELCALLGAALWWVTAPATGLSPDGLEMLAVSDCLIGNPCEGVSLGYWPPLWPALMTLPAALNLEEWAGRALNLLLAALVVAPLWRTVDLLQSTERTPRGPPHLTRWAGAGAAAVWILLPTVREHAVVLDARPLGWCIGAWCLWATIRAVRQQQGWGLAVGLAAVAPLARPEGIALPVLVAAARAGTEGRTGLKGAALGLLVGLVPHTAFQAAFPSPRGAVEAFFSPWIDTWRLEDLLALYGPASLPTDYRHFALQTLSEGTLEGPRDLGGLLFAVLGSVRQAPLALGAAVGSGLLGLSVWGAIRLAQRSRSGLVGVVLGGGLVMAIAAAPMSGGQATRAANFVGLIPLLLVAVASVFSALSVRAAGGEKRGQKHKRGERRSRARRRQGVAVGVLLALVLEVHLGPLREPAPRFLIGTPAARLAADVLAEDSRLALGPIHAGFEGRGILRRAGLSPSLLPSTWEAFTPASGDHALLVDAGLIEAGRSLEMLEDPAWRLCWVAEGDGLPHLSVPPADRTPDVGWVALLRFEQPCLGPASSPSK